MTSTMPSTVDETFAGPATRSIAVVLREAFESNDDAVRLLVVNSGTVLPAGAQQNTYLNVVVNGVTVKVPVLASSACRGVASGTPVYVLATRTQMVVIGRVSAST